MSLRGANILFKDYYAEEAPVISIDRRKGRSQELNDKRNNCLLHRYHYHRTKKLEGKRISYESLVATVADEFFISPTTVTEVMIDLSTSLSALNTKWPLDMNNQFGKHCEKIWPHLVW